MMPHCNSFGPNMLKDKNGAKVQNLRITSGGYEVDVAISILRKWLGGVGDIPATWDQLVQCLHYSGLNAVADDVDECLI